MIQVKNENQNLNQKDINQNMIKLKNDTSKVNEQSSEKYEVIGKNVKSFLNYSKKITLMDSDNIVLD